MRKRVLLTGAGGFVGHHTLEHLLVNTDWDIVCTDSFRHMGKTDRIREVLEGQPASVKGDRVSVLTHDLRVPITPQFSHAMGHIDYVISMASESHVDRSCVEPRPFIENNVALVLTLLEYARESGVEKFLQVSTDEVYGPAPIGHNHREGEPHRPSNPYSASKAAQEDIVYSYWRTFGLPLAVSNTMNIIGERQDPEKFVPMVIKRVNEGTPVQIHSEAVTGRPGSRFYLHARNQADALLFLLENIDFPKYGEIVANTENIEVVSDMARFNVVGEREVDNLEMAEMIAASAGKKLEFELVDFHSSRPGHDLRYALDGSFMEALGWTPRVPLEASLDKTVRWTLEHPEWMHA